MPSYVVSIVSKVGLDRLISVFDNKRYLPRCFSHFNTSVLQPFYFPRFLDLKYNFLVGCGGLDSFPSGSANTLSLHRLVYCPLTPRYHRQSRTRTSVPGTTCPLRSFCPPSLLLTYYKLWSSKGVCGLFGEIFISLKESWLCSTEVVVLLCIRVDSVVSLMESLSSAGVLPVPYGGLWPVGT